MKIRMLKDWQWHKAGDVIEMWEGVAKQWILDGIAARVTEESRSVQVERATVDIERRKVRQP